MRKPGNFLENTKSSEFKSKESKGPKAWAKGYNLQVTTPTSKDQFLFHGIVGIFAWTVVRVVELVELVETGNLERGDEGNY